MDMENMDNVERIQITSPSFIESGLIPKKHTGFDIDISPQLNIKGLSEAVVSIAIVMDDLNVPFIKILNHWIIWNIPRVELIPEGIPGGEIIREPFSAIQGIGYGKHKYRGPKQPPFIKKSHQYRFFVYALDCMLDIAPTSNKSDLMRAMQGHVIQKGTLIGQYTPERKV